MQKHVEVAEAVLSKPERLVPVMQKALITAQEELLRQQTQLLPTMTVKKNLHPRLVGKPVYNLLLLTKGLEKWVSR